MARLGVHKLYSASKRRRRDGVMLAVMLAISAGEMKAIESTRRIVARRGVAARLAGAYRGWHLVMKSTAISAVSAYHQLA